MVIFNSLGSNYDLKFVLASLFTKSGKKDERELKSLLEEKYDGKAILLYKGREAIRLALEILNLSPESSVAINGFTCVAVYKAIEEAGYKPICLDLDKKNSDLNFSAETFEKILKSDKSIRAVIVQNTLGYPADIEKIAKICREKNIFLIEDLAHCIGTKYENGKEASSPYEAGRVGDLVVLSFSQDKVIDAVSGGALIDRRHSGKPKAHPESDSKQAGMTISEINLKQQLKDRLYPLLTYKIRSLYDLGIGKPMHFILKKLNLLSKPMQEGLYDFYSLPNWYCNLTIRGFDNLEKNLEHRRKIAQIYADSLEEKILSKNITRKISLSSNLRFPIFIDNRESLIKYLKRQGIFVSDIWYDDVSPDCPNAVEASKKILNLPTHINVNENEAKMICERINECLKSQ